MRLVLWSGESTSSGFSSSILSVPWKQFFTSGKPSAIRGNWVTKFPLAPPNPFWIVPRMLIIARYGPRSVFAQLEFCDGQSLISCRKMLRSRMRIPLSTSGCLPERARRCSLISAEKASGPLLHKLVIPSPNCPHHAATGRLTARVKMFVFGRPARSPQFDQKPAPLDSPFPRAMRSTSSVPSNTPGASSAFRSWPVQHRLVEWRANHPADSDGEGPNPCGSPGKVIFSPARTWLGLPGRSDAPANFGEHLPSPFRLPALLAGQKTGFRLTFSDDVSDKIIKQSLHARSGGTRHSKQRLVPRVVATIRNGFHFAIFRCCAGVTTRGAANLSSPRPKSRINHWGHVLSFGQLALWTGSTSASVSVTTTGKGS